MYKIVFNNEVIDTLEEISYIKWKAASKCFIKTNKSEAEGFVCSKGIFNFLGSKTIEGAPEAEIVLDNISPQSQFSNAISRFTGDIDALKNWCFVNLRYKNNGKVLTDEFLFDSHKTCDEVNESILKYQNDINRHDRLEELIQSWNIAKQYIRENITEDIFEE